MSIPMILVTRWLRTWRGQALRDGAQVQIGGNESYVALCRRHWREAMGDRPAPPD